VDFDLPFVRRIELQRDPGQGVADALIAPNVWTRPARPFADQAANISRFSRAALLYRDYEVSADAYKPHQPGA